MRTNWWLGTKNCKVSPIFPVQCTLYSVEVTCRPWNARASAASLALVEHEYTELKSINYTGFSLSDATDFEPAAKKMKP